ncbi:Fc.00g030670.m01.CDS01 [Cosmosporella sp. VM-42]
MSTGLKLRSLLPPEIGMIGARYRPPPPAGLLKQDSGPSEWGVVASVRLRGAASKSLLSPSRPKFQAIFAGASGL